jgi:hypothetical protein
VKVPGPDGKEKISYISIIVMKGKSKAKEPQDGANPSSPQI